MTRRRKRTAARGTEGARVAAVALLGALLSVALYGSTRSFDFVNWDDWEYVLLNAHLGAFDADYVRWCLTAFYASNWHPATMLSYGLDYALWGRDPAGFHLTNVLLHAANTALVVWLAWRLLRRSLGPPARLFGAAGVGLAFAVHPLHVESVAWVSERKDLLYGFFWLAALIAWLDYADPDASPRERRRAYALCLASYVVSALSKPMAVTLPLVLLVLDVHPLGRLGLGRLGRGREILRVAVIEKLPFYAISVATGVLAFAAQRAGGAIGKAGLSLTDRLWVAERALGSYLVKWVAPITLVPFYPLEAEIDPLTWPYLASLALLAVLVAVAVALRRRTPAVGAGLACHVVTLLPVLGLVQLGYQSAADRYMYIPMLVPTLLVGAGAALAWQRGGARIRRAALGTAAAVVVLLGWRTLDQLPVWKSSVSLWTYVVSEYPDSTIAHYDLGHAYAIAGLPARAEAEWKRSLDIDAAYAPALYELGAAAGRRSAYREALRYFRSLIAADPGHVRGRLELAKVLDGLGEWGEAARHYREFVRIAPPSLAESVAFARSRLEAHGSGAGERAEER